MGYLSLLHSIQLKEDDPRALTSHIAIRIALAVVSGVVSFRRFYTTMK
jgi:hypothetical protein